MELLFVSMIVVAESAGQGFLKEYAAHLHPTFLALGAICYFGVVLLLAKTLQSEGMGVVNLLWSVASIISVFAIGMVFFHERMTAMQMIGAGMSVLGVAIVRMA